MEPKTMALLATVAGGSLMAAGGALSEGQAIADTENLNAQLAEDQGKDTLRAAISNSSDSARQHRRLLARMRVSQGMSGLGTEGTFGEVMAQSAKNMAVDRQRIVDSGIKGDYYSQVEAAGHKSAAKNAKKAGKIRAVGSLLGGATDGMMLFRG